MFTDYPRSLLRMFIIALGVFVVSISSEVETEQPLNKILGFLLDYMLESQIIEILSD